MCAGHCATVDCVPRIRRFASAVGFREREDRTSTGPTRSALFLRPREGSPASGSPGAHGRAGIPVTDLHAPGYLRWLVPWRFCEGARRPLRRVFGSKAITATATFAPVRG